MVCCPLSAGEADEVWKLLPTPRPALAALSGVDWNRDLSPWTMPKVFQRGEDFGGGGPAFLDTLTRCILPEVEKELGFIPVSRVIAGYSLAGLFALWTATRTDCFNRVASMSGSLWFDGFMDYFASRPVSNRLDQAYLSLGDQEKNTANRRMASVEECTCRAAELLKKQGIEVTCELNSGGHFKDTAERIAKGIAKVLE